MSMISRGGRGLVASARARDACGVGCVVDVAGHRRHSIIELGRQVLVNLLHRGATGGDETTGDGAGILIQIPHELFQHEADRLGFALPAPGRYAVGMVFGPRSDPLRRRCDQALEESLRHQGLAVLGWRQVPVRGDVLGEEARAVEPTIRQVVVRADDLHALDDEAMERRLYLARKRAERLVRERHGGEASDFYVASLSCRTLVYKGLFVAPQLFAYYPDLADDRLTSALAIVHQRYSTNTFPSWRLAQPFRLVAHNGEINTLSGNVARMQAREPLLRSDLLGPDLSDLHPIVVPGGSDSAMFDNTLELLVRAGRSLPHAMMMMIPEVFGAHVHISTDKRAFYEYHASLMEPWDGPAAMLFTDGKVVGGTLDRNGLRPNRTVLTTDGLLVMASEAGVVDLPPERVAQKGRLQPGRMFLVDLVEGRIVSDNEIKSRLARRRPYRRWLAEQRIELRGLYCAPRPTLGEPATLAARLRAFGYTREDLEMLLAPMAQFGQEPVGSMGTDTPLAVLSDRPVLLFSYFKQLFAQVTNPPIDPLREGLVMSLMSFVGRERNLLEETPEHCRQLRLAHPILTNEDVERLRTASIADFKVATVSALFDLEPDPAAGLRAALDRLVGDAAAAVRAGASLLVVTDRHVSPSRAAIPSLLATAAVHRGLRERGLRADTGLVIESGEPREVMHFCLLTGYGASAVNPYLAFEAIDALQRRGDLSHAGSGRGATPAEASDNYVTAIKKGMLKVMSKMGISTYRSYRGAQLFEAIGLDREVVGRYFEGTASRIEGVGLDVIAAEAVARHRAGFDPRAPGALDLDFGGDYHLRLDGERHLWNPTTITRLRHAVIGDDAAAFEAYARHVDDQSQRLGTLRGLFDLVPGEPVPLDEVEPASEIVKRFNSGAISHGSIGKEAHETLAIAMNRLGARSNTGEGGEDEARYEPLPGGDSSSCAIKQVASGRFGVTLNYLAHARVLQIKMAQGAKPGEGGQLPGHKVTEEIARLRHATPGVTLISPPPHHDVYSIEDLAQLIYDLKCANPGVEVSVKLVAEVGVGTVAAGVAKGNADAIQISGHDGGTGASPLSSIKHAGAPWELGLAETQQTLVLNRLRDRVTLQVDGQLRTGRDVVVAALLGAEEFGFGTASLVALGCVMMRKCHLGTCPTGIATQDPELRRRFAGRPEHVERLMRFVAEDARRIMAGLGFRAIDEMVGRVDRLDVRPAVEHWKARGLDLSPLLAAPAGLDESRSETRRVRRQPDRLASHLDWKILETEGAREAIDSGSPFALALPIRNVDRTVGAILSHRVVAKHGPRGLLDGTIEITFTGSAGQSFGAFLAPGLTLRLVGDANDGLGKGLSGGRIVVVTPPGSPFVPHENVIAGNTLLYGATAGEAFVNGLAGERFAVRNSGAVAVVEGVGDHGCEYMTGGTVVVLGQTGRNFGAGMSGGVAYVLDELQLFDTLCNLDMVELEGVWHPEDQRRLRTLVEAHLRWTGSPQARRVLEAWPDAIGRFVKVVPIEYREALERLRAREERQEETTPATEEVYRG